MGELNAFENFKFNIGDVVEHRACAGYGGLVVERLLIQSEAGLQHAYRVTAMGEESLVREMEIELPPLAKVKGQQQ